MAPWDRLAPTDVVIRLVAIDHFISKHLMRVGVLGDAAHDSGPLRALCECGAQRSCIGVVPDPDFDILRGVAATRRGPRGFGISRSRIR